MVVTRLLRTVWSASVWASVCSPVGTLGVGAAGAAGTSDIEVMEEELWESRICSLYMIHDTILAPKWSVEDFLA